MLLHVSDLHLGKTKQRDDEIMKMLDRGSNIADTLAITGDITDNGEEAAWKLYDEVVEMYDRVYAVMGNHDAGGLGITGAYKEKIDLASKHLKYDVRRRTTTLYPNLVEYQLINSCQLDSGFTSRGCSGSDALQIGYQLPRLVETYPVIVLVHHDPTDQSLFLDWPAGPGLLSVLPPHSILLCGHVGSEVKMRVESGVTVCNADGFFFKSRAFLINESKMSVTEVVI